MAEYVLGFEFGRLSDRYRRRVGHRGHCRRGHHQRGHGQHSGGRRENGNRRCVCVFFFSKRAQTGRVRTHGGFGHNVYVVCVFLYIQYPARFADMMVSETRSSRRAIVVVGSIARADTIAVGERNDAGKKFNNNNDSISAARESL